MVFFLAFTCTCARVRVFASYSTMAVVNTTATEPPHSSMPIGMRSRRNKKNLSRLVVVVSFRFVFFSWLFIFGFRFILRSDFQPVFPRRRQSPSDVRGPFLESSTWRYDKDVQRPSRSRGRIRWLSFKKKISPVFHSEKNEERKIKKTTPKSYR